MDPNLFHLDYERLLEVLLTIIFLALVVERALSLLFESRPFILKTESGKVVTAILGLKPGDPDYDIYIKRKKKSGLKEIISLILATAVCWLLHFDALTIALASSENTTIFGYLVTGAVIAGGSKASIAIFMDWLGVMSTTEKFKRDQKKE